MQDFGVLAHLGEHRVCNAKVVGSRPTDSTIFSYLLKMKDWSVMGSGGKNPGMGTRGTHQVITEESWPWVPVRVGRVCLRVGHEECA